MFDMAFQPKAFERIASSMVSVPVARVDDKGDMFDLFG